MPHEGFSQKPPVRILQGTDIAWTVSLSDFDSAVDTLVYVFSRDDGSDATLPTVSVTPDGNKGWDVLLSDVETTTMEEGRWVYDETVDDAAGVIHFISRGHTEVMLAAGVGNDTRSYAYQIWIAIQVALGTIAGDQSIISSYSIQGRSIAYMSPAELQQWEAYWFNIVQREKGLSGQGRVVSFFR